MLMIREKKGGKRLSTIKEKRGRGEEKEKSNVIVVKNLEMTIPQRKKTQRVIWENDCGYLQEYHKLKESGTREGRTRHISILTHRGGKEEKQRTA